MCPQKITSTPVQDKAFDWETSTGRPHPLKVSAMIQALKYHIEPEDSSPWQVSLGDFLKISKNEPLSSNDDYPRDILPVLDGWGVEAVAWKLRSFYPNDQGLTVKAMLAIEEDKQRDCYLVFIQVPPAKACACYLVRKTTQDCESPMAIMQFGMKLEQKPTYVLAQELALEKEKRQAGAYEATGGRPVPRRKNPSLKK